MFKKITKHKNNKSIQALITKIITRIKKKRQENNNKEHEGEGWRVAFKTKERKTKPKGKESHQFTVTPMFPKIRQNSKMASQVKTVHVPCKSETSWKRH